MLDRPRVVLLLTMTGLWIGGPAVAQAPSDPPAGTWSGTVELPGFRLPFAVTFSTTDAGLEASMDIPVQNAFGLPLARVSTGGGRVHFELEASIGLAVWDGAYDGESIEGEFTQNGQRGSFRMTPGGLEPVEEPDDTDLPYRVEELAFDNGDVHLAGTLTLPEGSGPFPAVVMITGSGAQNRDEELFGFRPFRVIADHLTRLGVAVLRYDDRGVGGSSGDVAESTTSDFADDVVAGVDALAARAGIDGSRVGLIGHSEGGLVAPLAASRSDRIAFAVLIAGTSVTGAEIIYDQGRRIALANGATEEQIEEQTSLQRRMFEGLAAGADPASFRDELETAIREGIEEMTPGQRSAIADVDAFVADQVETQLRPLSSPWFRFFLKYDPAPALREMEIPVLALFGSLDLQVSVERNRGPMAEALASNPDATIEVIEGANHLFQAARTGSPLEYAELDKAFIPGFLDRIGDWILARAGR